MWFVYLAIIAIITWLILEKVEWNTLFFIGIVLTWCLFIYLPAVLYNKKEVCNIIKTEHLEYVTIKQDLNGSYFVLDKEYNKTYPKVIIVKEDTKYIEKYYKQKNFILDGMIFDFTEKELYLNMKDVE